jgi:hyperosmotically inducible periplasmic protein
MRASRAFLIGVGTAYFLDPRLGRRRRTVVRDRGLKTVHELTHAMSKKARFAAGQARGVYARGRRLVTRPDVSTEDSVVEQRIRSEAFRDLNLPASHFHVQVENGVATVTGSVPDDEVASRIVTRVAKVAGVENVEAALRVADETSAADVRV